MPYIPKYKSMFISDVHLGSAGSRSADLLWFLRENLAEQYYFVGDIFDFKLINRGFNWKAANNDLVRYVLKLSNYNSVKYIPGNHDEALRDVIGMKFGNIEILNNDIYTSISGKQYLVLHGDEADKIVSLHPHLALIGGMLYELLIVVNIQISRFRALFKMKYWSFSEFVKKQVKDAVKFITHFEDIVVGEAKKRNCDGVICGHIHTPADKMINSIHYLNCGDWIGNRSVVVENFDGKFEIITMP